MVIITTAAIEVFNQTAASTTILDYYLVRNLLMVVVASSKQDVKELQTDCFGVLLPFHFLPDLKILSQLTKINK